MNSRETASTAHRDDPDARLAELLLYTAAKSEFDRSFGAVKLNKALFYADFLAYVRLDRPITGSTYRRLRHGPVPRSLPRVRERLVSDGRAVVKTMHYHGYEQRRLIGLDDPDLDIFTAREIAIVDEILDLFRDKNATELSELSHQFRGWELADNGEDIPYAAVFLATEPTVPTAEERAFGEALARSIG